MPRLKVNYCNKKKGKRKDLFTKLNSLLFRKTSQFMSSKDTFRLASLITISARKFSLIRISAAVTARTRQIRQYVVTLLVILHVFFQVLAVCDFCIFNNSKFEMDWDWNI